MFPTRDKQAKVLAWKKKWSTFKDEGLRFNGSFVHDVSRKLADGLRTENKDNFFLHPSLNFKLVQLKEIVEF